MILEKAILVHSEISVWSWLDCLVTSLGLNIMETVIFKGTSHAIFSVIFNLCGDQELT